VCVCVQIITITHSDLYSCMGCGPFFWIFLPTGQFPCKTFPPPDISLQTFHGRRSLRYLPSHFASWPAEPHSPSAACYHEQQCTVDACQR